MILRLACLAGLVLTGSMAYAAPEDEALFTYKGKAYAVKDLPPSQQQILHDLKSENFMRLESFVDQVLIEQYIDAEVKSRNKPRADVEEDILKVPEPNDKALSDWYEANKSRLPPQYKLEQIRDDIRKLLKQEGKKKVREELVQKLRKEGKLELAFKAPVAPTVGIAIDGMPMKGPKDAKVTIVEFADYHCPHCKEAVEVIGKILKKYDGKVRFVFMDFPLQAGGGSEKVALGAYCAEKQGKYWEYHDLAYAKQKDMRADAQNGPTTLAKELKLDEKKFDECLKSSEASARIAKSRAEGDRVGVTGTPAIYVNGQRVRGHDAEEIENAIKSALGQA